MSDPMYPNPDHDTDANSQELFEALAAEEPPIEPGDTNPSATKPRPAVWADGNGSGRWMSAAMLFLAVVMIITAGFIFLSDDTDDGNEDDNATVPAEVIGQATSAAVTPTDIPPSPTNSPQPTAISQNQTSNQPLPTAAADEQLLALLTPVAVQPDSQGVIQRDNEPFTEQIGRTQDTLVTYTVQSGDTLDSVRQRFGLDDLCTLVWSNDRNKVSPLRPGNVITVPPIDGVYARIREMTTIDQLAETTGVDPLDIIDSPFNTALRDAQPDSLLVEGIAIMIPGGNGGDCNIWGAKPSITSADGGSPTSNTGQYNLWGCSATVSGGGFPTTNPLGGSRYQFFQGFSAAHTGVDLSADLGTPIYAAGLGTVVFAGVNQYGYGNTVVIAHGTTFTLYGHLNSIGVRCGQDVSAGQTIGTVGSTGRSSGPHLHFEIRDAGFNPLDPVYTIGF